jgi:hypothetical protein
VPLSHELVCVKRVASSMDNCSRDDGGLIVPARDVKGMSSSHIVSFRSLRRPASGSVFRPQEMQTRVESANSSKNHLNHRIDGPILG